MGWPGAGGHLGTGVALPANPTSTFSCLSTHLLISPSTHLRRLSSANNPPQQRGASGPRAFAAVCAFPGVEMWFPGPWLLHYSPPQSLSVLIHCQLLTWPWQHGSGWAVCTHPVLSHFSQLLPRQEASVCRACSDPVHTFICAEIMGPSSNSQHKCIIFKWQGGIPLPKAFLGGYLSQCILFPRVE